MTADRAYRPARRRAGWIVLAVGAVFAVAGIVLPFILGAAFVSYPGGTFDQTTSATGSFTLLVDPATLALQPPRSQPLHLNRRLRTLESGGGTVIVQQDDSEQIGQLPALHFAQRYAIDQGSVRNVASLQAYAYAPGNQVDRSPAYSVNLPLGTGTGPYPIWDDATGQSYPLTAQGSVTRDGLNLDQFHGHLAGARVSAAFLTALAPLGLPSTLTLDQLTTQLKNRVDVTMLRNAVRALDAPDQNIVNGIIGAPITVDYRLTIDARLLVYPPTGTIVSLDHVDQTLDMSPDITGIGRVLAIISQPKYAANTTVMTAAAQLATLIAKPPTTTLATWTYQQDARSVATIAAFAKSRGDDINTLTFTIPLIIGLIGLVLMLVALALLAGSRRRAGAPSGE